MTNMNIAGGQMKIKMKQLINNYVRIVFIAILLISAMAIYNTMATAAEPMDTDFAPTGIFKN